MNTSLTTTRSSPVPIIDAGSSHALAIAKNLLTRDYPAQPEYLVEPLPPAVRSSLEHRKSQLDAWLCPAPREDYQRLTKAIAEMLGAFAAGSTGSVQATVAKYLQVVQDLPTWAIIKACSMLERGEAEGASIDYRPSAPRVREVARVVMQPWLEELAQARSALAAPAPEPEDAGMRERVGGLLRDLAGRLRSTKPQTAE